MKRKGQEHTDRFSAKPGHSEHQTGLTMDVSSKSANNELELTFANTKEGKWLKEMRIVQVLLFVIQKVKRVLLDTHMNRGIFAM